MTPANMKSMTLRGISLFVAIAFTVTTLMGSPSQAFAFAGVKAQAGISMIPARSRGFDAASSQTQLLNDLYSVHLLHQLPQNGSLIPRTGSDLKNLLTLRRIQYLRHVSNNVRLRNGLTFADG